MYMYKYEKRVKYYGHIENHEPAISLYFFLNRIPFSLLFDKCSTRLDYSDLCDNDPSVDILRAFGSGLEQALVGAETSFTIDATSINHTIDDVKVVVTST